MPLYSVKLQQGKRTVTDYVEGKSVASVLAFFEYISTMKVAQVLKVEYTNPSDTIPPDDFNYNGLCKVFAKNTGGLSRQFIFHNLKKTIDEKEVFSAMKLHLEVSGQSVDSIYCPLFKM